MSLDARRTRPRRGRPPARNEILRGGPAGRPRPRRARRPLRDAALRLRPRRRRAAGRGAAGRPAGARSSSPTRSRRTRRSPSSTHLGRLGLGADVASGGELATVAPGRASRRTAIVMTGPGKRDDELGRRSRPASAPSPSNRPASWHGSRRSPRLRAGASRSCSARPSPRTPGSSASASSATTGPASSGWTPRTSSASARRAARRRTSSCSGCTPSAPRTSSTPRARRRTSRRPSARRGGSRWRPARPLRLVDAGGGLGIPYEPHEESLDLVRLGAGLPTIVADWPTRPARCGDARLLLEPGRFLVGPAGAYLARVVDRKTRRRRDRRHPRWRRPPRAAAGPRRPGASAARVQRRSAATRPACAAAGWSRSPSPARCAPASTCSASRR